MNNKRTKEEKAENLQILQDLEQQVKDGLITRKEADRKIREIMAS